MARPLTALTAQSHSLRGPGPGPGLHGPPVSGPWATEHHADLQSQRWPGEGAAQCLQLACTKCVMPDPAPLEGKSRLQCGEPRPGHCLTRMEAKEHNVCPSPGSPCWAVRAMHGGQVWPLWPSANQHHQLPRQVLASLL